MTYGSEPWTLTMRMPRKVHTAQRNEVRITVNLEDVCRRNEIVLMNISTK